MIPCNNFYSLSFLKINDLSKLTMNKERVLLAMSGGVDSSVAAKLLLDQGYDVVGLTLQVWSYEKTYFGKSGGKSDSEYIADAQNLAANLNIEHHLVDIQDQFYSNIITPFIDEYLNARTPNPCVLCNPTMKWGTFVHYADQWNCKYIATGHYVSKKFENGRFFLVQGKDAKKDQSYVLWKLSQQLLERSLFPLGDFNKEEIKKMAQEFGFKKIAEKQESYDICFIPNGDYRSFLQLHAPEKCERLRGGVISDTNGKWLGKHKGFPFYTIGQRKGLEVAMGHPVYVTRLLKEENRVVLGEKKELLSNLLVLNQLHIQKYETLPDHYQATVRIRYKDAGEIGLIRKEDDHFICEFQNPVSAATPGQSAVFYENDHLVGGAIIEKAFLI